MLLIVSMFSSVHAQNTMSGEEEGDDPNRLTLFGTVTNAKTDAPLPGAHVFVAGTMIGTVTNENGEYRLGNVPRGASRVHVSMMGFKSRVFELFMRRSDAVRYDFSLNEDVVNAEGVVVSAERDKDWVDNVEKFEEMFFGPSQWAKDCHITNPEVLRFETTWWGKFDVRAVKPIVIENRALGYKIEYFLRGFDADHRLLRWKGEPLFSELTPSSPEEARRWERNRLRAYHGSLRHFLRSLLRDRVMEERFHMFQLPTRGERESKHFGANPRSVDRDDILYVDADSVYRLKIPGTLRVIYDGAQETKAFADYENGDQQPDNVQSSEIRLEQASVRIGRTGRVESPYALTVDGYFAFHRTAGFLPFEYVPDDESLFIGDETALMPQVTERIDALSRPGVSASR
ncbi:carboxypeptidase-like regulatory domain-containing protein [Longibacter salinarum]|nr:carboxypeptidase-like regulatory domain-containing protein [Longibacter salinarum]